jgi:hypothetical protein
MAYEKLSYGGSASSNCKQSRATDCSPVLGSPETGTLALATPDVVPHSCKHCQRLVFIFEDSQPAAHQAGATFTKIEFDFTYLDVARAASEDCLVCQWIIGDPNIPFKFGGVLEKGLRAAK